MTVPLKGVGAITLFVEDSQRSKSFYQRVFDLPIAYEYDDATGFKLENTIINLLEIPAARELIDPAPVADRAAGSRFQLTIWVDNADAACVELTTRGVELINGPMDSGWGMRTAAFSDPDGHVWEVAQKLPAAESS
jgi:catechol 2,3-dioxygenase-like lactoylglutathione lyase family enzyme